MEVTEVCTTISHAALAASAPAQSKWPDLATKMTEVDRAVQVATMNAQSCPVLVGDVKNIEEAVRREKGLMDSVDAARIDAESYCASLQAHTKSEKDRKYLIETGKQIRSLFQVLWSLHNTLGAVKSFVLDMELVTHSLVSSNLTDIRLD